MANPKVRYYYSNLSKAEQKIFDSMYEQISDCKKEIRVLCSSKEAQKLIMMVYKDCPEFFYIDITQVSLVGGMGFTIIPLRYTKNITEIRALNVRLNAIRERFLQEVQKRKLNNRETVQFVHDFLIKNTVYAHEALATGKVAGDVSSICGALLNRKAVCMGISLAAKWLLDAAGIPSGIIEGNAYSVSGIKYSPYSGAPDQCNHAWNIVDVNDIWQYMDITMDLGGSNPAQKWISYDYYLRSDMEIQKYAQYSNPYETCVQERDSYFTRKKTIFCTEEILKKYMQYCVRYQVKRIYFEVAGKLAAESENMIYKIVTSYLVGQYTYKHNNTMGTYDFLIQ